MTLRSIFEGIGDIAQWSFGLLKVLGEGFNGIGVVNVFWMLVITGMIIYWIGQMRQQAKRGEH